MEELRKVPFLIALFLIFLCVLIEVGGASLVRGPVNTTAEVATQIKANPQFQKITAAFPGVDPNTLVTQIQQGAEEDSKPPGFGISYLALIDVILVFAIGMMALALALPEHVLGKIQGILSLIFSLVLIIGGIILIIIAFLLFTLMLGLFFGAPFGTIIYLALFGFFDTGRAGLLLAILMALKIGFVVFLLLANQRFLENKSLILLVLTSLIGNIIVSFLHAIVPFFLVSITDALAAIVLGILGVIWGIIMLVGAIIAVVEAILTR